MANAKTPHLEVMDDIYRMYMEECSRANRLRDALTAIGHIVSPEDTFWAKEAGRAVKKALEEDKEEPPEITSLDNRLEAFVEDLREHRVSCMKMEEAIKICMGKEERPLSPGGQGTGKGPMDYAPSIDPRDQEPHRHLAGDGI